MTQVTQPKTILLPIPVEGGKVVPMKFREFTEEEGRKRLPCYNNSPVRVGYCVILEQDCGDMGREPMSQIHACAHEESMKFTDVVFATREEAEKEREELAEGSPDYPESCKIYEVSVQRADKSDVEVGGWYELKKRLDASPQTRIHFGSGDGEYHFCGPQFYLHTDGKVYIQGDK